MRTSSPHPEEKKLLALLDGELAPVVADQIREHCGACAQCRDALQDLSAVHEMIRAHAPSGPLRPAWPFVKDRLGRGSLPRLRSAFGVATTAAALVGVLLGVVVGSIGNRQTENEGSYLWSRITSSSAEEGCGTLPDIYSTTTSGEGR
jgi:hypothetical protein